MENIKLHEGDVVDGRYRIVRPLGRGGFATVYEAHHLQLDRPAALKVLDPVALGSPETFRARFLSEARIAANLDHPNVVKIFDFGLVADEQPYIAMEKLPGVDLDTYLVHQKTLPTERAMRLFMPVLAALQTGHQKGVVHKDLKPSNLFLVNPDLPDEKLVILDFGIARIEQDDSPRLTQTGSYTGTPAYMPPEYIQQRLVTPAFDVYQFGLMFIEVLIGRPVIVAATSIAAMVAHVQGDHDVPEEFAATEAGQVLMRAIEVDHTKRYQNAGELMRALATVDFGDTDFAVAEPKRLQGGVVSTRESSEFGIGATLSTGDFANAPPSGVFDGHDNDTHVDPATRVDVDPAVDAPVAVLAPQKPKSKFPVWMAVAALLGFVSVAGCVAAAVIGVLVAGGSELESQIKSNPNAVTPVFPNLANKSIFGTIPPDAQKLTTFMTGLNTIDALFIFADNYHRTAGRAGHWKPKKSVMFPSSSKTLGDLAQNMMEKGREASPPMSDVDVAASAVLAKLPPFVAAMTNLEAFNDGVGDQSDAHRAKIHKEFEVAYRELQSKHRQLLNKVSGEVQDHAKRCQGEDDAYFVAMCGVLESSFQLMDSAYVNHRSTTSKKNLSTLKARLGELRKVQQDANLRLQDRMKANPSAISAVYDQGRDLMKETESLADTASASKSERHGFVDGAYYVLQRYTVARQTAN